MRAAARRSVQLTVGLLGAFGLLIGLAVAPALAYYASADPQALWQAGGATALFIAASGAAGYATRRDLTAIARVCFWALLALIVAGLVLEAGRAVPAPRHPLAAGETSVPAAAVSAGAAPDWSCLTIPATSSRRWRTAPRPWPHRDDGPLTRSQPVRRAIVPVPARTGCSGVAGFSGDDALVLDRQAVSGDFGIIPDAAGAPHTY